MTAHTSNARSGYEFAGFGRRVLGGAVGGAAGGIVFGAMMAMMGMLVMIAGMMGSSSPWVGFGIHMTISIFYGIVFTVLATRWLGSWAKGLLVGAIYGIILWVIGPLLIMPMMMGGALFAFNTTTMMSLIGHIIYGLVVAAVAIPMVRRRS
ncbi:MAG: hypothetical protein CVT61_02390 [Actinobacteria bacterium HGW-Actinobacteria-11]|nr:MAG: hypothetical protein CVT61_02390 [Actinobacteria bacterium HGW-Actinobacteria-11]